MNLVLGLFLLQLLFLPACTIDKGLVITNCTIVDVEKGVLLSNKNIYLEEGIISAIDASATQLKNGYKVLKADGQFLIPGLIDAHVHTTAGPPNITIIQLEKTIKGGVTTVRDMGGDVRRIQSWQKTKPAASIPTILSSAIFAGTDWMANDRRAKASAPGSVPGTSPWLKRINRIDEIPTEVQIAKDFGVDAIKAYADLSSEQLVAIVQAAKETDLPIYAHATVYPIGPLQVVRAGVDIISHAERLLTILDSTIATSYHTDQGNTRSYRQDQLQAPPLQQLIQEMQVNETVLDATLLVSKLRQSRGQIDESTLETIYELCKQIKEAGIRILAGTDFMITPGGEMPNLHEELVLLKEHVGFTDLEALQAATYLAAKHLGLKNQGQVKEGFQADLVLLEKNPLEDIQHTRSVLKVIKNGVLVK